MLEINQKRMGDMQMSWEQRLEQARYDYTLSTYRQVRLYIKLLYLVHYSDRCILLVMVNVLPRPVNPITIRGNLYYNEHT